jgi:hypothetical protein
VREFLAEAYLSRSQATAGCPDAPEIARAVGLLARGGQAVRLTRCIYIPEDEISLYLFMAESAAAVREAAAIHGLQFERIVEAVSAWHQPSLPRPTPAYEPAATGSGDRSSVGASSGRASGPRRSSVPQMTAPAAKIPAHHQNTVV